jgi:hypothetical protein
MQADNTQRVMGGYFEALATGHFQQFLTDDVTWTTVESGAEIKGAGAVEQAVNGLHSRMSDLRTRHLVLSDRAAILEGTCAGQDGGNRIAYCVAYDLLGDRIVAMRAYGQIASLMERPE